jgi:exodeoxyribonuclease V gamma subunit
LALTATWPDRPFESVTIGRAQGGRHTISMARIGPLGPDARTRKAVAELQLGALVELFDRGMREPLPLYCKTSAAWAAAPAAGGSPRAAAAAWESGYNGTKEDKEPEHVLVLGDGVSFTSMAEGSGVPRPDETGDGWDRQEQFRFGLYARRLWGALLEREGIVDQ